MPIYSISFNNPKQLLIEKESPQYISLYIAVQLFRISHK